MKKHQTIILWVASFLVVFLVGYFNSVTSPFAPLSGTIGLQGHKLSYRFERKAVADTVTRVIFRSDNLKAEGFIRFIAPHDTVAPVPLKKDNTTLTGFLPRFPIGSVVKYEAVIYAEGDTVVVPAKGFEGTTFFGKVPRQLSGTLVVLMIFGILFAMRATLETARPVKHLRRFTLIAGSCFFLYGIVLEPLVLSYKIGAVGHRIVQPQEIFSTLGISLALIWAVTSAFVFSKKFAEISLYAATGITILLFLLLYSPV